MVEEKTKITVKTATGIREYDVPFPNVGQYYSIECLKAKLSSGVYGQMLLSSSQAAVHALDMIDIEATLTVLCPQLIADLKVGINALSLEDYADLRNAYSKSVVPFFKEINKLLS